MAVSFIFGVFYSVSLALCLSSISFFVAFFPRNDTITVIFHDISSVSLLCSISVMWLPLPRIYLCLCASSFFFAFHMLKSQNRNSIGKFKILIKFFIVIFHAFILVSVWIKMPDLFGRNETWWKIKKKTEYEQENHFGFFWWRTKMWNGDLYFVIYLKLSAMTSQLSKMSRAQHKARAEQPK